MWKGVRLALLVVCLVIPSMAAAEVSAPTLLIHAKTSLKIDDAQICAVPNVAWAALEKGYDVTILLERAHHHRQSARTNIIANTTPRFM